MNGFRYLRHLSPKFDGDLGHRHWRYGLTENQPTTLSYGPLSRTNYINLSPRDSSIVNSTLKLLQLGRSTDGPICHKGRILYVLSLPDSCLDSSPYPFPPSLSLCHGLFCPRFIGLLTIHYFYFSTPSSDVNPRKYSSTKIKLSWPFLPIFSLTILTFRLTGWGRERWLLWVLIRRSGLPVVLENSLFVLNNDTNPSTIYFNILSWCTDIDLNDDRLPSQPCIRILVENIFVIDVTMSSLGPCLWRFLV